MTHLPTTQDSSLRLFLIRHLTIHLVENKEPSCRDAELLYRSGLGFMALGPEGMATGCSTCKEKRCIELNSRSASTLLPLSDNRRAATLLLNLAQTLLNQASLSEDVTAAAVEAASVSDISSRGKPMKQSISGTIL